jgi:hypothetical protein
MRGRWQQSAARPRRARPLDGVPAASGSGAGTRWRRTTCPSRSQREIVLVETSALAAATGHAPISVFLSQLTRATFFPASAPAGGLRQGCLGASPLACPTRLASRVCEPSHLRRTSPQPTSRTPPRARASARPFTRPARSICGSLAGGLPSGLDQPRRPRVDSARIDRRLCALGERCVAR